MSLSEEPAFSLLKDELVCGYRDISKEPWAGYSGRHEVGGNAIHTTNGAGPHNLQTFILASDGTVLTCLPGFWAPQDLVSEVEFAARLSDVYSNPKYGPAQRRLMFRSMHIAHIKEHSHDMSKRSHMQHFDQRYEADNRFRTTDTIKESVRATLSDGTNVPGDAFKTTDVLMHERMSKRPFLAYADFDTPRYVDYGKPHYDKNEDERVASGMAGGTASGTASGAPSQGAKRKKETIGNDPAKKARRNQMMKNIALQGLRTGLRFAR
ncbi:hypothetical protein KA183_08750 [bacterium]|nr:hypothetical protein [bacterium]QQR56734.1 MAG: hypothetical protein IPG59_17290 [Candidatus Melainabacteria bacterium]